MKKKILAIALTALSIFSLAACSDDKKETTDERTYAEVKLGQYKGIQVDASLKEVPQEDIDAYLESVLSAYSTTEEVTEGVVFAKDDIVKLSYTCTVDGEEYQSQEGVNVELTDDGFDIDGFVDSIIGKVPGDKYEITLTVPEEYEAEDIAGKEATFAVTLTARMDTIVPEFTDAFVAENFDYLNLSTMEDMLAYLTRDLLVVQIYNEIIDEIMDNAEVVSYDSERLAEVVEDYAEYQEYYIYYMTSYDLDSYLALIGQSKDDFMASVTEASKEYLKQEMVYQAIADAEGIVVSDEEIEAKKLEYSKNYGYDTVEEFWEAAGMTEEEFALDVLVYTVQDFICDNVEYVEGLGLRNEEESSSETESSSAESESTSEATE